MDLFMSCNGIQVDLDDPETYRRPEWKTYQTTSELHGWAWSELGKSLYYMRYFQPDLENSDQAQQVDRFCFWYAQEWQAHLEDTEENRVWFRKFIFKFLDEVENQC